MNMISVEKILMTHHRQFQQQKGAASVEAALYITFILAPIFIGLVQMSNILVNYVAIVNAASAGANYFVSSASSNAYSNSLAIVKTSASTLNANNLSITTTVNGTACNSSSCDTALNTKANYGKTVTFKVSYTYTPIPFISNIIVLPSTLSYTVALPAPLS